MGAGALSSSSSSSAAAAAKGLPELTAAEVGDLMVASFGEAYIPYRDAVVAQGVTGAYVLSVDVTEKEDLFMRLFKLGVTNDEHTSAICGGLVTVQQRHRAAAATAAKRAAGHMHNNDDGDEFTRIGATLVLLQRLRRVCQEQHMERWTTAMVAARYLQPQTAASRCSFEAYMKAHHTEVPHPDLHLTHGECFRDAPTLYVSHAWKGLFLDLVAAVDTFTLETFTDDGEGVWSYWVDLFCENPWVAPSPSSLPATAGTGDADASAAEARWWGSTASAAIGGIGRTLLVLSPHDAPWALRDARCLWEAYCTTKHCADLIFQMSATQRTLFGQIMRRDFNHVATKFCTLDIHDTVTGDDDVPEHGQGQKQRQRQRRAIVRAAGHEGGHNTVNQTVMRQVTRASPRLKATPCADLTTLPYYASRRSSISRALCLLI